MKCCMSRCRQEDVIIYYDMPLCDGHWTSLCHLPTAEMKDSLGVNDEPDLDVQADMAQEQYGRHELRHMAPLIKVWFP